MTANGETAISVRMDPATRNDLWTRRLRDGREDRLPLNTASNESYGRVSPDGQWVSWVTDQSGRPEVWIARFPTGEARRQVSTDGGTMPTWTRRGTELIYVSAARSVMAVPFRDGAQGAVAEPPTVLFAIDDVIDLDPLVMPTLNTYVTLPAGDRFLVATRAADPQAPPIHIAVFNWSAIRPQ